jgi:hypothetical protein
MMRNLLRPAVTSLVLICLACSRTESPKSVAGLPREAFAPLTETDVARFARALPAMVEYVDLHGGGSSEKLRMRDDMAKVLATGIDWIAKTDGVDSVLAANGADWPFFRAMLYRLSVCAWAVGLEDGGMEQQQRIIRAQTTRAMASALRKRLKQIKDVADAVPPANVEIFKRHYRELGDFMRIVDI